MPQLSGVNSVVLSVIVIDSLRSFDVVWSMTSGGPYHSSELLSTYMYSTAFQSTAARLRVRARRGDLRARLRRHRSATCPRLPGGRLMTDRLRATVGLPRSRWRARSRSCWIAPILWADRRSAFRSFDDIAAQRARRRCRTRSRSSTYSQAWEDGGRVPGPDQQPAGDHSGGAADAAGWRRSRRSRWPLRDPVPADHAAADADGQPAAAADPADPGLAVRRADRVSTTR